MVRGLGGIEDDSILNTPYMATITLSSHTQGAETPGVGAGSEEAAHSPTEPLSVALLKCNHVDKRLREGQTDPVQDGPWNRAVSSRSLRLLRDTPDL